MLVEIGNQVSADAETSIGGLKDMRKVQLLLLGLLTTAICAVASAPALGADEACSSTIEANKYCLQFSLLANELELELIKTAVFLFTQENAVTHELSILTATVTKISCTAGTGEASTESDGAAPPSTLIMKGTITFTGCTITSANKVECEVDSTITAAEIQGVSTLQSEEEVAGTPENRVDTLFTPEVAGGTFATFTIKSTLGHTCTQAQSKGKVKGEELCYWLDNATEPLAEDRETHLIQCVETAALTFAGTTADLNVEFEVLLFEANGLGSAATEDDKWGIIETQW